MSASAASVSLYRIRINRLFSLPPPRPRGFLPAYVTTTARLPLAQDPVAPLDEVSRLFLHAMLARAAKGARHRIQLRSRSDIRPRQPHHLQIGRIRPRV